MVSFDDGLCEPKLTPLFKIQKVYANRNKYHNWGLSEMIMYE